MYSRDTTLLSLPKYHLSAGALFPIRSGSWASFSSVVVDPCGSGSRCSRCSKERRPTPDAAAHPESDSKSKSSLHTFILYLRQQYAFCPRWWYLFRFVLSRVHQSKNPAPYVSVMRFLLAGHRKERRLLLGYLHLPCDESKEMSFDRCFDKSKHNAYLYQIGRASCRERV